MPTTHFYIGINGHFHLRDEGHFDSYKREVFESFGFKNTMAIRIMLSGAANCNLQYISQNVLQIDALRSASHWLIFKKLQFHWLRVPPS